MREVVGVGGVPTIRCGYCGNTEPLPADLAERTAFLRGRLRGLAAARARVDGLGLVMVRTRVWTAVMWIGIAVVAVGGTLFAKLPAVLEFIAGPPEVPYDKQRELLAQLISTAVKPAFLITVIALGTLGMFAHAARNMRPLLAALPPLEPGAGARCRACGGTLVDHHEAVFDCGWCGAQNFVTQKVAHAKAMSAEEAAMRYRLNLGEAEHHLAGASNQWMFYAAVVVALAGAAAIEPVAMWMLPWVW